MMSDIFKKFNDAVDHLGVPFPVGTEGRLADETSSDALAEWQLTDQLQVIGYASFPNNDELIPVVFNHRLSHTSTLRPDLFLPDQPKNEDETVADVLFREMRKAAPTYGWDHTLRQIAEKMAQNGWRI